MLTISIFCLILINSYKIFANDVLMTNDVLTNLNKNSNNYNNNNLNGYYNNNNNNDQKQSINYNIGLQQQQDKKCEPITVPMCRNIQYNMTHMPNQFNHETQQDAAVEV